MEQRHINKDYKIIFKMYILGKIPIIKVEITKDKLEKMAIKEKFYNKLKKISLKMIKERKLINRNMIDITKIIDLYIDNVKLNIEVGTENSAVTALIVPFFSTIIASVLFAMNKSKNKINNKFIVKPIYINNNLLKIEFSGIFEVKISHIIYNVYELNKRKRIEAPINGASSRRIICIL